MKNILGTFTAIKLHPFSSGVGKISPQPKFLPLGADINFHWIFIEFSNEISGKIKVMGKILSANCLQFNKFASMSSSTISSFYDHYFQFSPAESSAEL